MSVRPSVRPSVSVYGLIELNEILEQNLLGKQSHTYRTVSMLSPTDTLVRGGATRGQHPAQSELLNQARCENHMLAARFRDGEDATVWYQLKQHQQYTHIQGCFQGTSPRRLHNIFLPNLRSGSVSEAPPRHLQLESREKGGKKAPL